MEIEIGVSFQVDPPSEVRSNAGARATPSSSIAHAMLLFAREVAMVSRDGSRAWWFIAARDWDRFDAIVRQLRRVELPIRDHEGKAPLRARLQSYGRFLDSLLVGSVLATAAVMLWAA